MVLTKPNFFVYRLIFQVMKFICFVDFILNLVTCLFRLNDSGEAGKLVDSDISGKIVQLKEQIATLEKREER